jgi:hypothetical protein
MGPSDSSDWVMTMIDEARGELRFYLCQLEGHLITIQFAFSTVRK